MCVCVFVPSILDIKFVGRTSPCSTIMYSAELGGDPVVSTGFSLSMEMSRLTRDGTAEPVARGDQILRHERGQGNEKCSFFSLFS